MLVVSGLYAQRLNLNVLLLPPSQHHRHYQHPASSITLSSERSPLFQHSIIPLPNRRPNTTGTISPHLLITHYANSSLHPILQFRTLLFPQ